MNTYLFVGLAVAGSLAAAFIWLRNAATKVVALKNPAEYQAFPLSVKDKISPNTYKFRFTLPSTAALGLPTGKHILLRHKDVSRPYTPVSSDDDKGFFDLVVKVYPGGKMSGHLESMEIGDTIDVRGPLGFVEYKGSGEFHILRKNAEAKKNQLVKQHVKRVGLIAGGTGITPMLQIIRAVLKNPKDRTQLSLIFANVTEADILLRPELEKAAAEHKTQFSVFFTLDKPSDSWTQGKGFVTAEMIQKHLPPPEKDVLLLMCGPPPMMSFMEKNMKTLNYPQDNYFVY
jgi:cytochrome-b5 reductase